jgi:hypothetical protein
VTGPRLDGIAADVVAALEAEGVASILLKGATFARWLYDDPGERTSGDADLLVSSSQLGAAERVLGALGFAGETIEAEHGAAPVRIWTRADGGAVELLCSLPGATVADEDAWQVLQTEVAPFELAGRPVTALGAAGRAVVVALAAADKGVHARKPLEDLGRALARVDEVTWDDAAALAQRLGATPVFAAGLRLLPAGALLAGRLGLTDERTTAAAVRAGAAPDVRGAALALAWVGEQHGWRSRARAFRQVLFPSPAWMHGAYPFSARGRAALGTAYGWRLVVVVPRLVPAARAYLAARRGR